LADFGGESKPLKKKCEIREDKGTKSNKVGSSLLSPRVSNGYLSAEEGVDSWIAVQKARERYLFIMVTL